MDTVPLASFFNQLELSTGKSRHITSPPATVGLVAVNAKHYTLAALLATLAVAAIVTAFFVLLCPARLTFSVAHTGNSYRSSRTAGGSSLELNLTLAADNPSRRAKVTYESMFVDVRNSTAPGA